MVCRDGEVDVAEGVLATKRRSRLSFQELQNEGGRFWPGLADDSHEYPAVC